MDITHDSCVMSIQIAPRSSSISRSEGRSPVTVSSSFFSPGVQGASLDACSSIEKGWGAHAFGSYEHGVWSARTRRLIHSAKFP